MNPKALVAAMAIAALVVPVAVVAQGAQNCDEVEDESLIGVEGIYVADDGVWEESNGLDGLQRSAGECVDGDGNLVAFDADTRVVLGLGLF